MSFCLLMPALLLSGCSTLGVKIDRARDATRRQQTRILPASGPDERLSHYLAAAHAALPGAVDGSPEERMLYNNAVGEVVTLMKARHFAGRAAGPGPWGIEVVRNGKAILDPLQADSLLEAARVRISGLHGRSVQPGIGVPYVFCYSPDSPFLAGQPGISRVGITTPATAVLSFHGSTARLSFQDTLRSDHVRIHSERVRLAADFSAPIAVMISRSANRSIDIRALLFTRQKFDSAGLFQFQPYDPEKIPVVFVHGLLARPEAWTLALNGLLADPEIRKRYQFWFLLYPTGLPIWKSAALLRSELDRFHHELERDHRNPQLHRIVLIGHSMGGLISSLVIRQGGDKLWSQFSDVPIDKLSLGPEARRMMRRLIYFPPREDVSRVIFVATPHRGSMLAINPLARFFAQLIQLPNIIDRGDRLKLVSALREDVRGLFNAPPNSLRFLKANSPLITSIQKLPLSRKIPYHSIIGDRGRGDGPRSSDGVVPYWSSHLESAVSEKIVPSGHGANENAEAIEEMRRILLEAGSR
ncbi:MAG: alpha/beta fold hydrolase [Terrimicrobiaceae bacterium]